MNNFLNDLDGLHDSGSVYIDRGATIDNFSRSPFRSRIRGQVRPLPCPLDFFPSDVQFFRSRPFQEVSRLGSREGEREDDYNRIIRNKTR